MTPSPPCPQCGRPVPGGTEGICRPCLLRVTFGTDEATPADSRAELFDGLEEAIDQVPHLQGFQNYEILNELAAGGMGVVFRARQRGVNRLVALKMIRAGTLARPADLARFHNEMAAVARLQHPHIVALHETGEHDGQPWYSMELVEGPSLAQVLRRGPLPPRRAAHLIRDAAQAIQHAHERGVLHRDLKPSNLLLAAGDVLRITDFGLAKVAQRDSGLTQSDGILGSPHYMSPEQAAGRSREADARSDLYSLGAVLYECLTGRPPFQADSPVQVLKLVTDTEPVPPRQLNPSIPADLETICLKCLAKEPARRYGSAQELAEELQAYLDQRPIRARPTSTTERLTRWGRRNPALALALLVCALILVAGVSGITWQWRRAEARTRESREQLFGQLVARARAERHSGQPGQRLASLAALRQAAEIHPDRPEPRDEAIVALALFDLEVQAPQRLPGEGYAFLAPEAGLVAHATATNGGITLQSLFTHTAPRFLGKTTDPACHFGDFGGSDHTLLTHHVDGSLRLWDLGTGTVATEFPAGTCAAGWTPTWSAARRRLIHPTPRRGLRIHDLANGTHRDVPLTFQARGVSGSRDQEWVLAYDWGQPGAHVLVHTSTGEIRPAPELPTGVSVFAVTWSDSGQRLATAGTDQRIRVYRPAESLLPWREFEGHENQVLRLRFDPAEELLVSSSWDQTTRVYDLMANRLLLRLEHESTELAFDSTGSRLSWVRRQGGGLQAEVALRQPTEVCRVFGTVDNGSQFEALHQLEVSPDGSTLISATGAGVRLFDWATGRLLRQLTTDATLQAQRVGDEFWLLSSQGQFSRLPATLDPTHRTNRSSALGPVLPSGQRLAQHWSTPDGQTQILTRGEVLEARIGERKLVLAPSYLRRVDNFEPTPDGRWCVVGTGDDFVVWNLVTGQAGLRVPRSRGRALGIPHPRGTAVCLEEKTGLVCRRLPDGEPLWTAPMGVPVWSFDGHQLAVIRRHRIELVNPVDGRHRATLEHPHGWQLGTATFTPDGRQLVAGGARSLVQVWDLARLEARFLELGLHWEPVGPHPVGAPR